MSHFIAYSRHTTRHPQHNYCASASYFVTIRAEQHEPVFERPILYRIVKEHWEKLAERFRCVTLDEFVIMPDHVHGILHFSIERKDKNASLGRIIGAYKSLTTNEWMDYVKVYDQSWPGKLWQRNYHESIIRNPAHLEQERRYIRENPQRWQEK